MHIRAISLFLGLALAVPGATFTFDFESEAATAPPRDGALSTLSMSQSGFTLTITREGALAPGQFDIVSNTSPGQGGKPAGWGVRSLDPSFQATAATALVSNFSQAVNSFRVEFGDFGGDADDVLSLTAYNQANLGGASSTPTPSPLAIRVSRPLRRARLPERESSPFG